QHLARRSAERRADADLAGAPDHRVSHDPVDAHDGEDQRQTAKEGNHRGGGPEDPELHVGVEVLSEGFHREDRHAGRSGANLPANEFKQGSVGSGSTWRGAHMEEDVASKILREGHENLAADARLEEFPAGGGHDPDNLDRWGVLGASRDVVAGAHGTAPSARGRGSAAFGPLDALAQRVALGPELFREHLVDDGDGRGAWRLGFDLGERAAAPQRQTHGREVISPDAAPADVEGQALGGSGGVSVGAGLCPSALYGAVQGEETEGHDGSDAGGLHPGQRGETVAGSAIKLEAAGLVVAAQTGVGLDENGGIGFKAGFDAAGLERATDEKSGSGDQAERQGDLRYDEGIAREPAMAARGGILARLLLKIGDQ